MAVTSKPTLTDMLQKAGVTDNLSDAETRVFEQKMGTLDTLASNRSTLELVPTGNRWYGDYKL